MKNTAFLTLALGLLLSVFSCTKEGTIYKFEEGNACVSFPAEKAIINLSSEDNVFYAELWRGNTSGAASIAVNILVKDEDKDLIIPQKKAFEFADGDRQAFIGFSYNYNDFDFNDPHIVEIELVDMTQVSPSGKEAITLSVDKPLTYVTVGTATITYSDYWGEPLEATLSKANEVDGYYCFKNCYEDGYDLTFMVNGGEVTVPTQNIGYYGDGYGPFQMKDPVGTLEGDVLTIVYELTLPEYYDYSFGTGFMEVIELPAGWNK